MLPVLNDARLTIFFRIFLVCYAIVAVLFAFAFIESILAISRGGDVRGYIEDLLSFPLYLLIIWGLRRSWVRPLICGIACFSVLQMLLATVSGGAAENCRKSGGCCIYLSVQRPVHPFLCVPALFLFTK
ncbi:MAG TPA: hypothetical protein VLH56_09980 [Dissulfurispiraceae bacterium]|nr:hypothetical protein [Dissulfurispiraceae bacterium]